MAATSADQRKKTEQMIKALQQDQKDYEAAQNNRRKLTAHLTETTFVKREFDLLNSTTTPNTSKIFKKVGPILVPETHKSAQQTVNQRIELLERQIAEQEAIMKRLEAQIIEKRAVLQSA